MPSVTLPLYAVLLAFALVAFVALVVGAVRVNGRRVVGPWIIDRTDRRAAVSTPQRRPVRASRRAVSDSQRPSVARVVPGRAIPGEIESKGGGRS